jgi:hypothetical protein
MILLDAPMRRILLSARRNYSNEFQPAAKTSGTRMGASVLTDFEDEAVRGIHHEIEANANSGNSAGQRAHES